MGISLGVWFWVLQESKQSKSAEVSQKGEFCYTFFFSFCLQFFSWIPTLTSSIMDCNRNCKPTKPFSPQVIFGHVAYNKDGRQMKTCPYFHHATQWLYQRALVNPCIQNISIKPMNYPFEKPAVLESSPLSGWVNLCHIKASNLDEGHAARKHCPGPWPSQCGSRFSTLERILLEDDSSFMRS